MKLEKLMTAIDVLESRSDPIKQVENLAYHSDQVSPGSLFICIRGYKTDGHKYLEAAEKKGAIAAVVEVFQDNIPIPQFRVADSRQALAALADSFYDHPSKKLNLTGVTATNGKTTTTYMINHIFEEHGLETGLIGTVIVKAGNDVQPADLTTPESLDLQRYLQKMVENKVSHAVMEVSSSGLELQRVGNVAFDIVVINNISREHIDLHGSFEAYYEAKAGLVRKAESSQWAVLNLDCPLTAPLLNETRAKTLTYGYKNQEADITVSDLDLSTGRARFTVSLQKKGQALLPGQPASFQVELAVLGLHSVYNAMAAILVALLQNIPATTISKALNTFGGVERRFELIFEDTYKVIDDHFGNAGNIQVSLETLQMMDYNKLSLVYAIRGSRGVTVNRENAEEMARWAPRIGLNKIIATTSRSHVGEKDFVTDEELHIFKNTIENAHIALELYDQLPAAIAAGLADTGPGDVLLLGGAQGMDYGASLCLEQIHRQRPDLPREKVFAALKNRVAGV